MEFLKEKNLADIVFGLWVRICIKMTIALVIAIILFISVNLVFKISENKLGIFVIFLLVGIAVVYSEFKKIAAQEEYLKDILPTSKHPILKAVVIYISLTWRALVLVAVFLGILVFFSKSDIIGRVYAIILEFLVGYPGIYWYLKSRLKRF